jgi:hypothetical protein
VTRTQEMNPRRLDRSEALMPGNVFTPVWPSQRRSPERKKFAAPAGTGAAG